MYYLLLLVWFEPTSQPKCASILRPLFLLRLSTGDATPVVAYASPNVLELGSMYTRAMTEGLFSGRASGEAALAALMSAQIALETPEKIPDDVDWRWLKEAGVLEQAVALVGGLRLFTRLVIKCGERGTSDDCRQQH